MKKKNIIYVLLLLMLFTSCQKENEKIKINYAANQTVLDENGEILIKDKIALLWWDGNSEKIGLFNTYTDSLDIIGTVGDLSVWSRQCIVKDDTLYTFGYSGDDMQQLLYKNDLKTGALVSRTNVFSDYNNITIAGRYNNTIILLWCNDTITNIGELHTNSDSISFIGTVGDMSFWSRQCIVKDDTLYTFGYSGDNMQLLLYKNDLKTGALVSKTDMSSELINLTIAGKYNNNILLLWWNGTTESFGVLNTASNTITEIGIVGDLQWWQGLCFVNENTLYTFGFNERDESSNMLYKNDLKTGSLISKSNYNSNLTSLTISKNK